MRWALWCVLLQANFSGAVEIISAAPETVALTVYRENASFDDELIPLESLDSADTGLVMVSETRKLVLPAGESRIVLQRVADGIIPQTAKLQDAQGKVVESNFDYDLITPYDLLRKSIGEKVVLESTNLQSGQVNTQDAVIRSGEGGVMLEIDGHFEEFTCSGNPQRIIFHHLPSQLMSEPTLSVTVRMQEATNINLVVSYLAMGVQWRTDYVANIQSDRKTLDLSAWITLVNGRNTSFVNAPIHVIAGKIERDESETVPPDMRRDRASSSCWPAISLPKYIAGYMGGDEVEEIVVTGIHAAQSDIGDYKLYTLPEATTLSARQSKQVLMLAQPHVPFERVHTYEFDFVDLESELKYQASSSEVSIFRPTTTLRFTNTAASNLGMPLPSGRVSVMDTEKSKLLLIGESYIKDQPKGSEVAIVLNKEMDVVITPTIVDVKKPRKIKTHKLKKRLKDQSGEDDDVGEEGDDSGIERKKMDFLIENFKPSPVIVELQQIESEQYGAEMVLESAKSITKDGKRIWTIKLGAGESKHLRYEVDIKDY